jgi:hypothetical protein
MHPHTQRERIKEAKIRISENGGVINNLTKTVKSPSRPGLKVLAALDCLAKHAGYRIIKE